ncbi:hypothetical protein [Niabella aurantiaca]|uniref:hypothetical protein n=1 Tax=Niabella aurantiaca TaxID=379900 RepID=UPI0003792D42|nr:hypothetical protein [Niabella aurantiaca]
MKKLSILFAAVIAVAVLSISWKAMNNGAAVINDEWCGMYDLDGNFHEITTAKAVITKKSSGLMSCKFDDFSNPSGKAYVQKGEAGCWSYSFPGQWADYTFVVSASGQATLTCHFQAE